jgi:hypothetical protein
MSWQVGVSRNFCRINPFIFNNLQIGTEMHKSDIICHLSPGVMI